MCLLPVGNRKAHPVGGQRDLSADVFSGRGCPNDHDCQPLEGRIVSIAVAVDDCPRELLGARKLRSPRVAVVSVADHHSIKVVRRCSLPSCSLHVQTDTSSGLQVHTLLLHWTCLKQIRNLSDLQPAAMIFTFGGVVWRPVSCQLQVLQEHTSDFAGAVMICHLGGPDASLLCTAPFPRLC